jgi:hypothetical protein
VILDKFLRDLSLSQRCSLGCDAVSVGNRYPTFRPLNMRTLRCLATSGGGSVTDETEFAV